MSIIDETYFVGELSLPTDNAGKVNKLQVYIDRAQKKYLIDVLGYELYALFIAELPTPSSQRFTDILEGADFTNTITGLEDHWDGLTNTELQSLLAYFTYYQFLKSNQRGETGNGTTSNLFENSEKVSSIFNQQQAYNLGVEQYKKLRDYLLTNSDTYTEWQYIEIEKLSILGL